MCVCVCVCVCLCGGGCVTIGIGLMYVPFGTVPAWPTCSFHVGSGCQNSSAYSRAIEMAHKVFTHGKDIGLNLTVLDIGGGFPGHKGGEGQFSKVAFAIRSALAEWFEEGKVKVIAEPGRFFAASTHTLAVCVTSKREETTVDGNKVSREGGVCCVVSHTANICFEEKHAVTVTAGASKEKGHRNSLKLSHCCSHAAMQL